MKLILIAPYQNPAVNWGFILHEMVDKMEEKGALKGVEVDIDEGYFIDSPSEKRDEEFLANISVGVIKKVKEYSEMGKHDAIIQEGDLDPGFFGARFVSKIPFTSATHAAIHVASLIGDRCSIFAMDDWPAKVLRRIVQNYGFDHKVVSIRPWPLSSVQLIVRDHKKEDRKQKQSLICCFN